MVRPITLVQLEMMCILGFCMTPDAPVGHTPGFELKPDRWSSHKDTLHHCSIGTADTQATVLEKTAIHPHRIERCLCISSSPYHHFRMTTSMDSPCPETHTQPARPDNAFRQFTPLRGPHEAPFDGDAQIRLHVLCAKCKSLEEHLRKPEKLKKCFQEDKNKRLSLVYEHYETATLLRDSYKRGCHLCSLIWDSFVDLRPGCDDPRLDSDGEWDRMKEGRLVLELGTLSAGFNVKPVINPKSSLTRPRVGIELYVSKDGEEDKRSPVTLSMPTVSTKSATCRSFYKRCMEICDKTHTRCHVKSVERAPARLLLVAPGIVPNIHLVCPGDKGLEFPADTMFAALSYCWGTHPGLRLKLSKYQDLKTDMPFDQLSPTIQDSVLVTIELGLQYLWVDALCIIQDSPEDWNREAPKMYDVYRGCSVTITATGASDSGGGLFAVRDPLRQIPVVMGDWKAQLKKNMYTWLRPPWTLDIRGWVKQEQLLSARYIKFGSFITWQCNDFTFTELGPLTIAYPEVESAKSFYDSIIQPKRTDVFRTADIRKLWYQILQEYTETKFTRRSDRLTAIMGLASAFQRRTGWGFVCGHWEPFMIQDLLWYRKTPPVESTGLGPSWSWDSCDGGLYVQPSAFTENRRDVAKYLGVSSSVTAQTGSCPPSVLELSGVLFPAAHEADLPKAKSLDRTLRAHGWPDMVTVEVRYDQKSRPWTEDQMLLPLTCDDTSFLVEGLIIVPTGESGMFERVGFFNGGRSFGIQPAAFVDLMNEIDGEPAIRKKILLT